MLRASIPTFHVFLLARGSSLSNPPASAPSGVLLRQSFGLLSWQGNLTIFRLTSAYSSFQPLYFTIAHVKFNEGICFSLWVNRAHVFHTICCSVSVQWNWNNKNVITFNRFSVCWCFLCPLWSWVTKGGSHFYRAASESANIINLLAKRKEMREGSVQGAS